MLQRISLWLFLLWAGISIGVAFTAIPVVFSPAIKETLPPGEAGRVAQSILLRFFQWQAGIGGIAGLLYACELLRTPQAAGKVRAWILPPLLILSLVALSWVHPILARMHTERYALQTTEVRRRELAARFGAWHGVSQIGNVTILLGVLACGYNLTQLVGVYRTKSD